MAHVLVVDDDPRVLALLRDALGTAGHDVTTAEDGAAGLRAYAARRPDVLITDLIMPKRSGIDLVFAVRRRDPAAVIIAISGVGESFLQAGMAVGIARVFTKPFDVRDVVAAVVELSRA
jgi:DNA-binding response OmpR family regulator